MIPNLNELPPPWVEESPWKKLVRPLLGFLAMLLFAGGVFWLYTYGINQAANSEMSVMTGLRAVAGDLWLSGKAREVREELPGLAEEIARLGATSLTAPEILILPAENTVGASVASHEIIYMKDSRPMLSIRLFLDEKEGRVDLLSFRTGEGFETPASLR